MRGAWILFLVLSACGARTPFEFEGPASDGDSDSDSDSDSASGTDTGSDTDTGSGSGSDTGSDTGIDTGTITDEDPCLSFPDYDADGFDRPECGGDDCDDLDAATHPGAADPPGEEWSFETVDAAGRTGLFTSIAVDAAGAVHVAYYDFGRQQLRHAQNVGGVWTTEDVGDSASIEYLAIAVAPDGTPHVSYSVASVLWVASRVDGEWLAEIATLPASQHDIAIDELGAVHLAFYAGGDLGYSQGDGISWIDDIVDDPGDTDTGVDPSIAVMPDGTVQITYNWNSSGDLRRASGTFGDWTVETVDNAGRCGIRSSVAVDAGGRLHVSYVAYDGAREDLLYAEGGDFGWITQTLDTRGLTGQSTSLDLDARGRVHIVYPDWENDELRYATEWDGVFTLESIDVGETGWYPSLDIVGGEMHVSYHDVGAGDLRYAHRAVPVDEDCDGNDG